MAHPADDPGVPQDGPPPAPAPAPSAGAPGEPEAAAQAATGSGQPPIASDNPTVTAAKAMAAYVFPSKRADSKFTLAGGPTEVLLAGLGSQLQAMTRIASSLSGPLGGFHAATPRPPPKDCPSPVLVLDGIGILHRLLQGDLESVAFSRAKGKAFRAPKAPGKSASHPGRDGATHGALTFQVAVAAASGTATATDAPTGPSAAGGPGSSTPPAPGRSRPGALTLQDLLVCAAGCGLAPPVTDQPAALTGRLAPALENAVQPLRRALLTYLHDLQRVTGCVVRVVFPSVVDLSLFPAQDLGPSPTSARRHFAAALRLQRELSPAHSQVDASDSDSGGVSNLRTPDDSDPCHVHEIAASDEGEFHDCKDWCPVGMGKSLRGKCGGRSVSSC